MGTRERLRVRRAVRKADAEREADAVGKGELSIVPLLDVIVNLVVFLLMTTAMVSLTSEVSAATPSACAHCGGSRVTPRALELTVIVTDATIRVAGSGGTLAPGCETTGGSAPTIVRDGHEWDALRACAGRVHAAFPDEREVRLGADPRVPYEDVVRAMDALRAEGDTPLFPEVLLTAGVR